MRRKHRDGSKPPGHLAGKWFCAVHQSVLQVDEII